MPAILLSDVPKVGFLDSSSGNRPEDIPVPSCRAAVSHLRGRRFGEIPQP